MKSLPFIILRLTSPSQPPFPKEREELNAESAGMPFAH